jgi:alanyl-tRNA synthetase
MQYDKQKDGSYIQLKQQNIDTGLGVERVSMVLQGKSDIYQTELFRPVVDLIATLAGVTPNETNVTSFRIITDHMRASTFILGDERDTKPSNVDQGYVLRRFIRRAIRHGKLLGIEDEFCSEVAKLIISIYKEEYPLLEEKKEFILDELKVEEQRFRNTLEKGLKEFQRITEKMQEHDQTEISGKVAFLLFQSYGFPLEMTEELAEEKDMTVDKKCFDKQYKKHQELSRKGAEQKFKGGLSDQGENTVKLHTATHLLNEALRKVVDENIVQKGSNITPERLRFDFNFDRKLTDEELKAVEDEVNRVINEGYTIERLETTPEEAKKMGAQSEFGARYPPKVSIYKIDEYSLEICMGPHVKNTKEIGTFKITKEESSAAGIRRIKAVVEPEK